MRMSVTNRGWTPLPACFALIAWLGLAALPIGARPASACWSDAQWSDHLGGASPAVVFAMIPWNGGVVAGGQFVEIGGVAAPRVAFYSGGAWHPLGAGFSGEVQALVVVRDTLYAGGLFQSSGSTPLANVARWDGAAWLPLGSGIEGAVGCLADYQGQLIVGGNFTAAGGAPATNIARWTGTEWLPLGTGVGDVATIVETAVAWNDRLIVGGDFTTAGGGPAARVAQWDGAAWSPMADGFNREVDALVVHDGAPVAGGWFTSSGATPLGRIARWSGGAWQGVGAGFDSGVVLGLYSAPEGLYAAGNFVYSGGVWLGEIALRGSSAWCSLGSGIGYPSYDAAIAVCRSGDELFVGGAFNYAGALNVRSLAAWRIDPALSAVPVDPGAAAGSPFRIVSANPSNAPVVFSCTGPAAAATEVQLFNPAGERVATIPLVGAATGAREAVWDGSLGRGRPAPRGIYFARLAGGGGCGQVLKIVRR